MAGNPRLGVDPARTASNAYLAADTSDPRIFIEGSVRSERGEAILSFIVVAELPDGTRGRVRGAEFFTAMMDHFGDDAIDAIEGQWELSNAN
jgi:hypothetical protein